MEKTKIGNRSVGAGEPALIIAEIGSNHDRQWDRAAELIEAAAAAGADAVKFQLFAAGDLYPPGSAPYDSLKAVELPPEWIPRLSRAATEAGVLFICSPFAEWAVDRLDEVGVPAFKCGSSETTNLPLLRTMASKMKPILLATGMCDLADIHEAVEVVRSAGNSDVILMQCTSLYPASAGHVHLRVMDTLQAAFGLPVGLSDHTTDVVIPAAAVARGACVIEKHLTLNRALAGPDHSYALEPAEFATMVKGIRATEAALGSGVKTMLPEEAEYARRSCVRAARDIAAGETLSRDDLTAARPARGIAPRYAPALVGAVTRGPIAAGEPLTWENVR